MTSLTERSFVAVGMNHADATQQQAGVADLSRTAIFILGAGLTAATLPGSPTNFALPTAATGAATSVVTANPADAIRSAQIASKVWWLDLLRRDRIGGIRFV